MTKLTLPLLIPPPEAALLCSSCTFNSGYDIIYKVPTAAAADEDYLSEKPGTEHSTLKLAVTFLYVPVIG